MSFTKKTTYTLFIIILFSSCLQGRAMEIPQMAECMSMGLRASDGWWIMINRDGSALYGFGVSLAMKKVKKGTFSYQELYSEIAESSSVSLLRAEDPFMAFTCWQEGSTSTVEYPLARNRQLLNGLFLTAYENTLPPENSLEESAHQRIDSFWNMSSPLRQGP